MKTTATQNETANYSRIPEFEALQTQAQSFNNAAGELQDVEASVTPEQLSQVRGPQESLYVHHSQQTGVWASSWQPPQALEGSPYHLKYQDINLLPRYRDYTPSPTPEYGETLEERIRGVGAHLTEFEPMHARSDSNGSQKSVISIFDGSQRSGAAPQAAAGTDNSPAETAPLEQTTAPKFRPYACQLSKGFRRRIPFRLLPPGLSSQNRSYDVADHRTESFKSKRKQLPSPSRAAGASKRYKTRKIQNNRDSDSAVQPGKTKAPLSGKKSLNNGDQTEKGTQFPEKARRK
ncbi:uncharacterized protein CTHT_0073110 [Thermochaetoides thermophila DSM 1495]|uniref:Uncharacterized protein n=1 Tax=Chaetomium thermophilum (strain DSM 1495 / CBS 144.50 / IMI 039719) TaxID=759272 RepID=G0SHR6_CHATD|nr:hypothetical protein CTHT_0073110 [Thermochaetoides thermophila DSM 1495]EGS16986.1 hypothetical protein CTHT_0073110 [Thermochaetoides thermophila DSM 1495]